MPSSYYIEGFDLAKKPLTSKLFLDEGLAEVGFLEAALRLRDADVERVTILCFQGISKMKGKSETIVKLLAPDVLVQLRAIGVMADAEQDPGARISTIIECAKAFSFPKCAKDLSETGRHEYEGRLFAFSLSPSAKKAGRLEDLILKEVAGDAVSNCINLSLPCFEKEHQVLNEKAKVQMYISAAMNTSMAGIRNAFAAGLFYPADAAYSHHLDMVDSILGAP